MNKIFLALTFILLSFGRSFAQSGSSQDDLEKQRQQLKDEIDQTQKMLNETQSTTKANVGQLNMINKRINLQDNVIDNISGQIRFIDNDIYSSQRQVSRLSKILDTLKLEYAKSMVYAYKNSNSYDFLNFIFSASSFNDAIKRITYLKSYRTYRELQGDNILHTEDLLQDRIAELSGNKKKKNVALQEKGKEMSELEKQQNEKEKIVAQLKGRQKELLAQITNKRKQDAKLRSVIAAMIKREIELAKKKAEAEKKERDKLAAAANAKNNTPTTPKNNPVKSTKPAVKPDANVLVSSEADRILDVNFERNKGSLPWPADGFILNHFGTNTYPGNIIYENPGVNIGTKIGASVKAVFDGEVTLVNFMDDKSVVFIKHGKYFTVYSNLASSGVQRGQTVKTGDVIGKSAANDDGQGEVDLMIMKETTNMNPELWLRKK